MLKRDRESVYSFDVLISTQGRPWLFTFIRDPVELPRLTLFLCVSSAHTQTQRSLFLDFSLEVNETAAGGKPQVFCY